MKKLAIKRLAVDWGEKSIKKALTEHGKCP
jgi:hypothetical protein